MAGMTHYSEQIRMSMKTKHNATGAPVTIRQLAEAIGWSYENVRKVVKGEHDGSREFNEAVCTYLGLDEAAMWKLAQESKAQRRFGAGLLASLPKDTRLLSVWPRLTEQDRDKVVRIAEGLALLADSQEAQVEYYKKHLKFPK